MKPRSAPHFHVGPRTPEILVMFEFLKKRLEQLADSLIDPVWQRILGWSWQARLLGLLVTLGTAYIVSSPESAKTAWSNTSSALRVIFAGTTRIPVADDISEKVRELMSRLSSTLTPDLDLPNEGSVSPWATAQIILAIHQIGYPLDSNKLSSFFRKIEEPDCGCWREIPKNNGKPRNIFISGWILYAMALMGKYANPDEVQFLLDEQKQDGSWSVFPVGDPQYASSYGTAWAILGLNAQLQLGLADENYASKIANSVQKGAAWLIAHRDHGSRWKDYPLVRSGKLSESISGVVLHALHMTMPQEQLGQLDSGWLDGLPATTVKVTDADHPYVWLKTKDGVDENDDFVQIRLPWLVIGTADAYRNGGIIQRAKALAWLEQSIAQDDVLAADTTPDNWWRAELLLSLGYVLERRQRYPAQQIIPADREKAVLFHAR